MFLSLCLDNDPLGRIHPPIVPDHQIMELFFSPDDFDESRRDFGGDESNACTWMGVSCKPDRIKMIEFHPVDISLTGSIDFRMIPPQLESLYF